MSRVLKTVYLTAATGIMVDLRPVGSTGTNWNRVGYLKLRFFIQAGDLENIAVKPVVVADGDAAPAAPAYPTFSAHGDTADVAVLNALAGTAISTGVYTEATLEVGDRFSRGYNAEVHGPPLATHLAIASASSLTGYLVIEGE